MRTSAKKGTVMITTSYIVFMTSGYVINVFLIRHLGPNDYGIYGIIISIINIINIVQTSGIPQSVSKYISQDSDRSEEILRSGLILQILISFLILTGLYFSSDLISKYLKDPEISNLIKFSALILPGYGILTLYQGYNNGMHHFKEQTIVSLVYSISKTITIITLTLFWGIYGAISGFIISSFSWILNHHFPTTFNKTFSFKELISFSIPLVGFALISSLQYSIDLFFIKTMLGTSDVGYYAANQTISRIPLLAFSSFAIILFPSVSRNFKLNKHLESKQIIEKSLRIILIFLVPSVFLISATSSDFIKLLYSSEYLPAAPSLSILIIGLSFVTIFNILSNTLNGVGKPHIPLLLSFIGVVITAIGCLVLIPKLQLEGAALATTIGGIFMMLSSLIFVSINFKISLPLQTLLKTVTASLILINIIRLVDIPTIFIPLQYLLFFIAYFIALFVSKELTHDDLKEVKSFIPKGLKLK